MLITDQRFILAYHEKNRNFDNIFYSDENWFSHTYVYRQFLLYLNYKVVKLYKIVLFL